MAKAQKALRFVQRHPMGDAIADSLSDQLHVGGEPINAVPVQPSATAVQRIWIIPVEQRDIGRYSGRQQAVNKLVIKRQPLLVDMAGPVGKDSGPGYAEAIGLEAHLFHQLDVFAPAMIVVTGDIAGLAGKDCPILAAEHVPDAEAAAVLVGCAFDLIGRGRCGPRQTRTETT